MNTVQSYQTLLVHWFPLTGKSTLFYHETFVSPTCDSLFCWTPWPRVPPLQTRNTRGTELRLILFIQEERHETLSRALRNLLLYFRQFPWSRVYLHAFTSYSLSIHLLLGFYSSFTYVIVLCLVFFYHRCLLDISRLELLKNRRVPIWLYFIYMDLYTLFILRLLFTARSYKSKWILFYFSLLHLGIFVNTVMYGIVISNKFLSRKTMQRKLHTWTERSHFL